MPINKTFRLFLSSTFNDMREERDMLQSKVFPKLRKYCEDKGFSFQPIDLRWGVSSEAGNDQKTMQICIDEVKRCKAALNPHFAIILGERYGWIPLPSSIEANEFELIIDAIKSKYPIDSNEIEYLDKWYKKDENAIPAEYKLQPKIDFKDQDWNYWGNVENTLRDAFRNVVNNELLTKLADEQKFKYIKSATEQEIIEGLFNNKDVYKKNIYFYKRNFENIDSLKSEEFETLEIKDKEYNKKDSAYSITVKHFSDFKQLPNGKFDNILDPLTRPYHYELINRIKSDLPEANVKIYNLKLDSTLERTQDSVTQDYLQKFADDFHDTIFASMVKEIELFEEEDIQIRELSEQNNFLNEKVKVFVGRENFVSKIDSYIISEKSNAPLVIHADSGSGKSVLMAKAIQDTIKNHSNVDTTIMFRFVGTSQLSNNPINLLKSLYTQLTTYEDLKNICNSYISYNELQLDQVMSDLRELSKILANLIENYPKNNKLILFIDALDQFIINDPLDWLPRILSNNTKIIISTLPDSHQGIQYLSKLKQKYSNSLDNFLFLEKFNLNEANSMIDAYLASFKRKLTSPQKQKIIDSFIESGSPLYLKILLEEASQWNSYTNISNEEYPKELDELIVRLFERLHTHSHHSLPLINYAFAYIACSKDGLPEPELFDILSQEKDIMDDVSNAFYPRPQRLPTAVWARLYSQMKHYLSIKKIDGMDQISFFHRKFNEGAYKLNLNFIKEKDKYIIDKTKVTTKENKHEKLANFYEAIYNQTLKVDTSIESVLTELPYQLIMSNQKQKSLELLTNFEFLMKKFKLNRTKEVLEDYALAKAMGINKED